MNRRIELLDGAIIVDRSILVISDLHLGLEASQEAVMVPRQQWKRLKEKIEAILCQYEIKTAVLNGDIKHEFGTILDAEWRNIIRFFDILMPRRIVIVAGNHDKAIEPIAKKRNIGIAKEFRAGDILILHGDFEPRLCKEIRTVIIGHEHPVIKLRKGNRKESYKCFLMGKYKGRELVVMPSFHELTNGSDVLESSPLTPLLKSFEEFNILIVNKEIFDFGKVKNVRKALG